MNLQKIIQECEERTGFNDSAYQSTWKVFINAAIRDWSRKHPWPGLEDALDVVSDGTIFLVLPHYVDQVVGVVNKTDKIHVEKEGQLDRRYPGAYVDTTAGKLLSYDDLGVVAVRKEPTFPGQGIQMRSTSASDSGASFVVAVTGYGRSTAYSGTAIETKQVRESMTILGTGSVNSVDLSYSKIVSLSKDVETTGDIEILDRSSGDVISVIPRYENQAAFRRLRLLYKPGAGTLLEVRFRHHVPRLRVNSDAPHPSVDADFVIQRAVAFHWRSQHQYTKGEVENREAFGMAAESAAKQRGFSEPDNRIVPYVDSLLWEDW